MKIVIWSKKGGVGKTTLAYNIAKDLDLFLISNDDSVIEKIYPQKAKILNTRDIKIINNCVYDLGGFVDQNIQRIIKNSDVVIVPSETDYNSILQTFLTIETIQKIGLNNIIVVINKVEKNDDLSDFLTKLQQKNVRIVTLPRSNILKKTFLSGESVLQKANNPLIKFSAKTLITEYQKLINLIKGEQNG